MVRRKRQKHFVDEYNVLEVVDHTLAVQEVHRRPEKVPVECLSETQAARSRRHVCDRNHLLVADDLHGGHDDEHVDMAGEHGSKEDADHDKGPDRAGDECLPLLLELGLLFHRHLLVVGRPAGGSV